MAVGGLVGIFTGVSILLVCLNYLGHDYFAQSVIKSIIDLCYTVYKSCPKYIATIILFLLSFLFS